MKSKLLAVLALLLAVACLALSCGGKTAEKTDPESQTSPAGSAGLKYYTTGEVKKGTFSGEELVIPEKAPDGTTVTTIASFGFVALEDLKKVTLPDTLTTINASGFQSCPALCEVSLPAGLKKICNGAFAVCHALSQLTFRGTMEQWTAVEKELGWNADTVIEAVHCSNGTIVRN